MILIPLNIFFHNNNGAASEVSLSNVVNPVENLLRGTSFKSQIPAN